MKHLKIGRETGGHRILCQGSSWKMGVLAGGMDYAAVAMGIKQIKLRMEHDKKLQVIARQINEKLK